MTDLPLARATLKRDGDDWILTLNVGGDLSRYFVPQGDVKALHRASDTAAPEHRHSTTAAALGDNIIPLSRRIDIHDR